MSQVNQHIYQLREDFLKGQLSENLVAKFPSIQFENWMKDAIEAKVMEVQAFNLATVDKDYKPSSRIVYLREFHDDFFFFYTNFNSRKAENIDSNNHVCSTFFWPELERQIRIEGTVSISDSKRSDIYFEERPRESKIGAWSSPQSKVINNREELEKMIHENSEKFKDQNIPRPQFWGGYKIEATYYEFWQGRKNRLHDRIAYTKENNIWKIKRLAP